MVPEKFERAHVPQIKFIAGANERLGDEKELELRFLQDKMSALSKLMTECFWDLVTEYAKSHPDEDIEAVTEHLTAKNLDQPKITIVTPSQLPAYMHKLGFDKEDFVDKTQNFYINFQMPLPIAHFWDRGGETRRISDNKLLKQYDAVPDRMSWGEVYQQYQKKLQDALSNLNNIDPFYINFGRVSDFSVHDPMRFYYIWELEYNHEAINQREQLQRIMKQTEDGEPLTDPDLELLYTTIFTEDSSHFSEASEFDIGEFDDFGATKPEQYFAKINAHTTGWAELRVNYLSERAFESRLYQRSRRWDRASESEAYGSAWRTISPDAIAFKIQTLRAERGLRSEDFARLDTLKPGFSLTYWGPLRSLYRPL